MQRDRKKEAEREMARAEEKSGGSKFFVTG